MARRSPPPLAKAGFAIALAGLTLIVLLGLSRQVVTVGGSVVGCGSVFSAVDEPACDAVRADRSRLMWLTGAPLVVAGLGVVIFVGRREGR